MRGWLLDVNTLLGCGWKSHANHAALFGWLLQLNEWATCPIVESGFVRISMTKAYEASFDDTQKSLATLRALEGHRFVTDDVGAASLAGLLKPSVVRLRHLVTAEKSIFLRRLGIIGPADLDAVRNAWNRHMRL